MFQSKSFFPFLGRNNPADNRARYSVNQIRIATLIPFAKVLKRDNTSGMAAFIEAVTPARASGEKASVQQFRVRKFGIISREMQGDTQVSDEVQKRGKYQE